jgi:hypothetical protein
VLVPFKLIAYLLATLLVLFLLVSNLPAKSHSCQGLIHVFDIKIGFYLLLDLRCWCLRGLPSGWEILSFGGLLRNKCSHFAQLCLPWFCLLVELLAFLHTNLVKVNLRVRIFLCVWLESALRVLLAQFLLSHFLLRKVFAKVTDD